ncbi:MAG: ABC transporter ATP-binding protein [Verrucomicrobiales bacterium]|nr:ABC transporter ATP-binding protein [Verrucomicrobiales bacterium]|tara:strand:+ start:724 stop:1638 length:915 start_codon:yes stop_codon:yes gene_type:complete
MSFPSSSSSDSVISVVDLVCEFGPVKALDGVSLQVPRGSVFGLVGVNGAGKTTLIKHALGLLKPQAGEVKTLGMNPVVESIEVLKRIGYLSEKRDLASWMRVDELVRFTKAFYEGWDDGYVESLLERFQLRREAKVKTLSQGQLAKTALMIALAYHPELLILDEPSSGLDPIVRREILEAILRTIGEEGRTVFFSSHLLDEIERVCDFVAIVDRGKVMATGRMGELKERYRLVTVKVPQDVSVNGVSGLVKSSGEESQFLLERNGTAGTALSEELSQLKAELVEEDTPSFDEIFAGLSGSAREG